MKGIAIKTLLFLLTLAGTMSFAQESAVNTATATIVTPLGITSIFGMNFGNVTTSFFGGDVVINPNGTVDYFGSAVVTGGSPGPAVFHAQGEAGRTFEVSLPALILLTKVGDPGTTIMVDNFTCENGTTQTFGVFDWCNFTVGATLRVSPNQMLGVYESDAAFEVTINYN